MQNDSDEYIVVSLFLFLIKDQMDLTEEELDFIETYCLPDSKGKVNSRIKL